MQIRKYFTPLHTNYTILSTHYYVVTCVHPNSMDRSISQRERTAKVQFHPPKEGVHSPDDQDVPRIPCNDPPWKLKPPYDVRIKTKNGESSFQIDFLSDLIIAVLGTGWVQRFPPWQSSCLNSGLARRCSAEESRARRR